MRQLEENGISVWWAHGFGSNCGRRQRSCRESLSPGSLDPCFSLNILHAVWEEEMSKTLAPLSLSFFALITCYFHKSVVSPGAWDGSTKSMTHDLAIYGPLRMALCGSWGPWIPLGVDRVGSTKIGTPASLGPESWTTDPLGQDFSWASQFISPTPWLKPENPCDAWGMQVENNLHLSWDTRMKHLLEKPESTSLESICRQLSTIQVRQPVWPGRRARVAFTLGPFLSGEWHGLYPYEDQGQLRSPSLSGKFRGLPTGYSLSFPEGHKPSGFQLSLYFQGFSKVMREESLEPLAFGKRDASGNSYQLGCSPLALMVSKSTHGSAAEFSQDVMLIVSRLRVSPQSWAYSPCCLFAPTNPILLFR